VPAALLFGLLLQAASPPAESSASGWVKDEAGVLPESSIDRLNQMLAAHEKATSNQVVVLTVPSLGGQVVEAVALQRATELRIGQKDKDNGVLLLVAPNERQVRIEVGYGLEATLPDARASRIVQDEILPYFRRQDMGGGVEAGVRAILGTIDGSYTPSPVARVRHAFEPLRFLPRLGWDGQFMTGFFGGFLLFGLGYVLWSADEHWFRWVRASLAALPAFVIAVNYPIALVAFAVIAIGLLNRNASGGGSDYSYSSGGSSSWSGSSSSWSSSSSSSSSSSFSGGGGSFGGGGASGSW
jgi:uncharacterized protein